MPRRIAPKDFKLPSNARQLWDMFLRDKAGLTKEHYATDLRCFARFTGCQDEYEAIEKLLHCTAPEANATIVAYIGFLRDAKFYRDGDDPASAEPIQFGYAPATIRRRIYAIRSVTDLANTLGLVTWKINIKLRKAQNVRDTRGCGPSGYNAILDALNCALDDARETEVARDIEIVLRDIILVRLLHDSGLRRVETTRIEWPDGVILDPTDPRVLVLRKGRVRMNWKAISIACADAIREYVAGPGRKQG